MRQVCSTVGKQLLPRRPARPCWQQAAASQLTTLKNAHLDCHLGEQRVAKAVDGGGQVAGRMALSGAHACSGAGAHGRRAAGCRARGRATEHLHTGQSVVEATGVRRERSWHQLAVAQRGASPGAGGAGGPASCCGAAPRCTCCRPTPISGAATATRATRIALRPGRRARERGKRVVRAGRECIHHLAGLCRLRSRCGMSGAGCKRLRRRSDHCHLTGAAWALLRPWWPPGGARPHLREQPGEQGQWGSQGSGASRTTASRAAPFASQLAAAGAAWRTARSTM